jgi:hypothetical protein
MRRLIRSSRQSKAADPRFIQTVPSYRLRLEVLSEFLDKLLGPQTYGVLLQQDSYVITMPRELNEVESCVYVRAILADDCRKNESSCVILRTRTLNKPVANVVNVEPSLRITNRCKSAQD